jgi:hypothetical protein
MNVLLDQVYKGVGEQIFIVGDSSLPDLSPPGQNIGNRLVKHLRIAGSGLYKYHRSEARLYGLDESVLPGDQQYFTIYRDPDVLRKHAHMFARVPIITGHHVLVDDNNAKRLMVGMVGDAVMAEQDPRDGETYLVTTGTIVAGDGIAAYERWGQLSVGYVANCHWEKGEYKGNSYDAVLTGFSDVNHLLICEKARGGPQCMVMDSIADTPLERFIKSFGDRPMNLFQKIFGGRQVTAGDERIPLLLKSIAVGADPATQVAEIRKILVAQNMAGDAVTTLNEYLDELAACKDEKLEVKSKACDIVAEFYVKSMAGDSPPPDKDDGKKEGPPDDKKDSAPPPAGDSPPPDDKKDEGKPPATAGDELLKMYVDLKAELAGLSEQLEKSKQPQVPLVNKEMVGALNTLIGGDAAGVTTADEFMKKVFGKGKTNGAIW